jgi:hypothetical protein
MKPKTLRQALDSIQEMLTDKPYSADLWDVLVALRGPDCRNHKLKMATTAIIRDAAFPKHPTTLRSFYGQETRETVFRREQMFKHKQNRPHFREHIQDAMDALEL